MKIMRELVGQKLDKGKGGEGSQLNLLPVGAYFNLYIKYAAVF